MDIYIKPVSKVALASRNCIRIKEIAEVICPNGIKEKIGNVVVQSIQQNVKGVYLVSSIDIIRSILAEVPEAVVNNIGEAEVVVDYKPERSKDNRLIEYAKLTFIAVVLFIGSAVAIMSFHSDAELHKIFVNLYKIFLGVETDDPKLLTIPYSIGLGLGIIIFYNHFGSKKITDDPTPIEVELTTYEENVNKTIADILNSQRIRKGGNNHGNR